MCAQDEARGQLGSLQRELQEVTSERDSAHQRLTQLHSTLQECQEGNTHLTTILLMQSES